jgi:uncharacterized protein (TIGR02246 family)
METPTPDHAGHLEDVQQIASRFFEAWNRHDVPAMVALYTERAQVVNSLGLWWHGVAELESGLGQMNAIGPPLGPDSMSAHSVTRDTAICIVDYTVAAFTRPGGQSMPEQKALSTFFMVRSDSGWLIAAAQTTAVNAEVIARLQSR